MPRTVFYTASGHAETLPYQERRGHAIVQGDIILDRTPVMHARSLVHQAIRPLRWMSSEFSDAFEGLVVPSAGRIWPARRIPYVLSSNVRNADVIREAVEHWRTVGGMHFEPAQPSDYDHVVIESAERSSASLGRRGGQQWAFFRSDADLGEVIHELGHTVGLLHEHTRADRDAWVRVDWARIRPEEKEDFNLVKDPWWLFRSYDYASVMHYPLDACARVLGQQTLVPLRAVTAGIVVGKAKRLSVGDLATIAKLYG